MKKVIGLLTAVFALAATANAKDNKLQGVTDTSIKVGAYTYFTGDWAVYGDMNYGIKAAFEKANAEGGIHGRKIEYVLLDGAQSVPKAVEATKRLMNQEKVMGFVQNSGELNASTYQMIEKKGLFDFFMSDNVTYKHADTRFLWQPSWTIEGKNMAEFIKKRHPGKKVAFIRYNGAFAKELVEGVKAGLGGKNPIGPDELVEYDAVNADAQVLNAMKWGADIIVLHVDPPGSSNIIKFANQKGFKPLWLMDSWNFTTTFIDLAGAAGEGAVVFSVVRSLSEKDHPAVKAHNEIMAKYMPKVKTNDGITNFGLALGQTMVEVFKRAGRDLNKETLIKAAESFKDWTCELCLVPANTGPGDHRFLETLAPYEVKGGKWTLVQ